MKKVRDLLRDMLLALAIGLGTGLVLILVLGGIGAIVSGLQGALEASRSGVLVVGGLLMIYAAILMLKGGNLPQDAFTLRPWKKQRPAEFDEVEPLRLFRVLPRQGSFLLISIGILVTSLIPEGIVLHYL